jgi:hypothetical protein
MEHLVHFKPKAELDSTKNLLEFIRMCRQDLTVFGSINWDETCWPRAMNFTKLGTHSRGVKESDRMDSDFINFAKAYFRYQQGHKPTKTRNESKALAVIEAALLQSNKSAEINQIDFAVLDTAAALARDHYSKGAAYHCGREIERLAQFICKKNLVTAGIITWKNPIKKPHNINIQTGPKAKALQDKKLPSQEALVALAEIFSNNPKNPKDTFTTSTFAMTMSAPSRISEILELPVDCEVESSNEDNTVKYQWRFYSAKGFQGSLKDIPDVMITVAKEAIHRIRALSEEPRKLANWIESNPNIPYRHADCPTVADDEPLTVMQACQYLGFSSATRKECQSRLHQIQLSTNDGVHTLNSLWQWALLLQPKGFPWLNKAKKIKYSNALFCMTRNLIGEQRGTSPLILWTPTNNIFNNTLSPRPTVLGHKNIFERYGYKDKEGIPLKLTSHQARHLISTLGKRAGLGDEILARWAGRANIKDNNVYNHMSEFELVAKAEAMDTSLTLFGPAGQVSQHIPITTQEINLMERGSLHISVWGVCSHDFIMSPCEKFRDCLNCEEHVCIKGSNEKNVNNLKLIKERLAQVEQDYLAASEALTNGYAGADRWFEYHQKTVDRLRQLVEILESPQIADGAQIKLRDGKEFSHLRRVIRLKAIESLELGMPNAALLDDMTKLLGVRRG